MRSSILGLATVTALASACGSGPARAPDAFFEGSDAGPPDAPFQDAFRPPQPDAYMPPGTDAGMGMTDTGTMMMADDAGMMTGDTGTMATGDAGMMATGDAGMMATGDAGRDASLMPVANDTCGTAIVVGSGTTMGSSLGAVNDYGTGTSCAGVAGVDVVYAIDVPAGHYLSASVESGDGSFDPSISLVDASCGGTPRTCLDGDDSGGASTVNAVDYMNTTGATARVYAVVDTYSSSSLGGPFELTVSVLPPASNDTCASAITVGEGTTMGTTVGAANDYGAGMSCAGVAGADVVYAIDVPAGRVASVSVTSTTGGFDPSISLVDASCGGTPRVCLDGDDSGGATTTNTADYNNTTGASVRIYAVVDSYSASVAGAFDLGVAFIAPATNDTCATATPVASGMVVGTTLGATNDYGTGTGCTGVAGADVAYAIDVAAGERIEVSALGMGGFNASLNLVRGPAATCGGSPRTCLASADSSTATTTDTVAWINETGAATTVYAIVDASAAAASGSFTLTVTRSTPPAGDVCVSAQRVAVGSTMGDTTGMRNDYGSGSMCAGVAGPDRVYVISVGAGQTLTASVTTGLSSFDPSISLEAACGLSPRVCLDGDDTGTATAVNTVTYMNTSAVAEDIYITIDTFSSSSSGGPFTLDVMLAP